MRAAGVAGSSTGGSCPPATPSLNSRIPLPSERPHLGQPLGPEHEEQHDEQNHEPPVRFRKACAHDTTGNRVGCTWAATMRVKVRRPAPYPLALWHCSRSRTCTSRSRTAPRSSRASISPWTWIEARDHGPERSGKSTLAYALMGHPAYEITEGEILLDGDDLVELEADERAQRGLLAFQYPHAVPGVTVTSFLRSAINALRRLGPAARRTIPIPEFRKELLAAMEQLARAARARLALPERRLLGGEKKRVEILQMALLKPRIAILDETDSGLDIDALRGSSRAESTTSSGPEMGAGPVITALPADPQLCKPDFVHVFVDGRIVAEAERAGPRQLERTGTTPFIPATIGSEAA